MSLQARGLLPLSGKYVSPARSLNLLTIHESIHAAITPRSHPLPLFEPRSLPSIIVQYNSQANFALTHSTPAPNSFYLRLSTNGDPRNNELPPLYIGSSANLVTSPSSAIAWTISNEQLRDANGGGIVYGYFIGGRNYQPIQVSIPANDDSGGSALSQEFRFNEGEPGAPKTLEWSNVVFSRDGSSFAVAAWCVTTGAVGSEVPVGPRRLAGGLRGGEKVSATTQSGCRVDADPVDGRSYFLETVIIEAEKKKGGLVGSALDLVGKIAGGLFARWM